MKIDFRDTFSHISKSIILAVTIMSMILITGCNSDKTIDRSQNEQNEIWKLATQGKLKGVEFGIGTSKDEIIKKLGKPLSTGNTEIGFKLYYEGFSFEFDDYHNSLEDLQGNAQMRHIYAKASTVGWVGTTADVKKFYGKPDQEFDDQAYGPAWIMTYFVDENHTINFVADKEGDTILTIYLL